MNIIKVESIYMRFEITYVSLTNYFNRLIITRLSKWTTWITLGSKTSFTNQANFLIAVSHVGEEWESLDFWKPNKFVDVITSHVVPTAARPSIPSLGTGWAFDNYIRLAEDKCFPRSYTADAVATDWPSKSALIMSPPRMGSTENIDAAENGRSLSWPRYRIYVRSKKGRYLWTCTSWTELFSQEASCTLQHATSTFPYVIFDWRLISAVIPPTNDGRPRPTISRIYNQWLLTMYKTLFRVTSS